ncbi:hypothetical protein [Streptomyces sp. NPDC008150]|uniref:hypothetical protein n=1 Tax=Streptomyces sp. NPDC008150 TaxID=3364816 RepID=UPI0036E081BF
MRRITGSAVVTLCAAASLTAAMTTVSAAATTASPATASSVTQRTASPVVVDCGSKGQVRPSDFVLACGDGNSRLGSLQWSQWNGSSAVGHGVNVVNDCKPYCAAGKFRSYDVSVRLDQPQTWKAHPQQRHYSQITLTYGDQRPAGYPQVVTFTLWS